jgi:pimeloyl-ACP methyl ester carboxylesterase
LTDAWTALQPPRFRQADTLDAHLEWLDDTLRAHSGRVILAGHSMGGALCTLAAALWPERVSRIVLVAPAGLPLSKPLHRSGLNFVGQVASRRFSLAETARSLRAAAAAPACALRLALAVRALDLSTEMHELREAQVAATVIGCTTDTLVTPRHCRRAAELLGASYHELSLAGGHMWMFGSWARFRYELARAAA